MTANNIIILENEQKDADGISEQLKSKLEAGIAGYYKKPYWKHYDY